MSTNDGARFAGRPPGRRAGKKHRHRARRRAKGGPAMKRACAKALLVEGDIRQAAVERGLYLRVSTVTCARGVVTWHWMFNLEDGRRVLDYWPGSGRWWCRASGERGRERAPSDVLEVATKLAAVVGGDAPDAGAHLFG